MVASIPGILMPIGVAALLDATHDWHVVFYVLAVWNTSGIVVAFFCLSTTSIDACHADDDLHLDRDLHIEEAHPKNTLNRDL